MDGELTERCDVWHKKEMSNLYLAVLVAQAVMIG